jgi:threonine-phosphate decarboxylase
MAASEPYPIHGGQLRQIANRFQIPVSDLLDFSANINPAGPPPGVLHAVRACLEDLSVFTEYPDLQELELKESIARYAKVDIAAITVANGFVPLLEAALGALRIRRCLLPVPAFVEYRKTLERAGVEVEACALNADFSFPYDPERLLIGAQDAILLANPQNPTGVCHDLSQMRELVMQALQKKMYVFLDEAFIDYIPEHSLTSATQEFSNLIVFRSVTKFHGIPGMRVAYAVANPTISQAISMHLPPWPITTIASRSVCAALADQEYANQAKASNVSQRTTLQKKLFSLKLLTYPSHANFLFFRLPYAVDPGLFWRRMIVEHHMVLRDCGNYEALASGHFRAAVLLPKQNEQLIDAIAATLASYPLGQQKG